MEKTSSKFIFAFLWLFCNLSEILFGQRFRRTTFGTTSFGLFRLFQALPGISGNLLQFNVTPGLYWGQLPHHYQRLAYNHYCYGHYYPDFQSIFLSLLSTLHSSRSHIESFACFLPFVWWVLWEQVNSNVCISCLRNSSLRESWP